MTEVCNRNGRYILQMKHQDSIDYRGELEKKNVSKASSITKIKEDFHYMNLQRHHTVFSAQ
jgi:hypothetical protein